MNALNERKWDLYVLDVEKNEAVCKVGYNGSIERKLWISDLCVEHKCSYKKVQYTHLLMDEAGKLRFVIIENCQ